MQNTIIITVSSESKTLEVNKVLRSTYALLSMTLVFSALTAGASAVLNLPHPGMVITLVGYFGLLFLTTKPLHSSTGLFCVSALTGFMGWRSTTVIFEMIE